MLLGRSLQLDLTVALNMSPGALRRGTEPSDTWTITALQEHARSITDEPDIFVRWDHPDHPAVRV